MPISYLRHGHKAWPNGKKPSSRQGYNHDPPLAADHGLADTLTLVAGNHYDLVILSPFLRVRETWQLLSQVCTSTQVITDVRIGEYLGNRGRYNETLDIAPETLNAYSDHLPSLYEKWFSMRGRVRSFARWLKGKSNSQVLIISHGVILEALIGEVLEEGQIIVSLKK